MILNIRFDYLELNVIFSPYISKGYIKIVLFIWLSLEIMPASRKSLFYSKYFCFCVFGVNKIRREAIAGSYPNKMRK